MASRCLGLCAPPARRARCAACCQLGNRCLPRRAACCPALSSTFMSRFLPCARQEARPTETRPDVKNPTPSPRQDQSTVTAFDLVETEDEAGTNTPDTAAESSRIGGSTTAQTAGSTRSGDAAHMAGSRSSVSSADSDRYEVAMNKRWTTFETVGRCMLLMSVAFFIIGVLITVFGFSNTGLAQSSKLPMQIIGPACLAMTLVMWAAGGLFSKLWNMEWKRQQQAIELRDRVQLHALAMDILHRPVPTQAMFQDPRMRRQLMMRLRQQRTLDISSDMASRRSSRAVSIDSRRRQSSVCGTLLQHEIDRRKSLGKDVLLEDPKHLPYGLPGIQISRIETLDLGEGSISGSNRGGSMSFIVINDVSSDLSRLSCPSDYSLAGSTSRSRSRSSRASSGVSSRLWDFSPRDSEWDADVSLGSRDSQLNVSKQDWCGGPYGDCSLSPTAPRKMPVVKFDMSSPLRRHSSPASAGRHKDTCECTCGKNNGNQAPEYPSVLKNRDNSCHAFRPDEIPLPSGFSRKKSGDQSILSLRIDEDERELDVDETTPLRSEEVAHEERRSPQRRSYTCPPPQPQLQPPCVVEEMVYQERPDIRTIRPPLKRNNTDDSEVERRVAKLLREIEFSVSDSVDESKINSQEYESGVRRVEAQTQTMNEPDLDTMAKSTGTDMTPDLQPPSVAVTFDGRRSSQGPYDPARPATQHRTLPPIRRTPTDDSGIDASSGRDKKSKFAVLSSALAQFGRKTSPPEPAPAPKSRPPMKTAPRRWLIHLGLSEDLAGDVEAAVKTPTNAQENV